MGFYEGSCVHQRNPNTNLQTFSAPSFDGGYNDQIIKTHLKKSILDLGFACFHSPRTRESSHEHNKAWLLAETAPKRMDSDLHSLHSSFRFSLCSQVELEKMKGEEPSSSSRRNYPVSKGSPTVLLVNLETGGKETEKSKEDMNWLSFLPVEKSLSPMGNTLVRFSYGEIVTATSNFSEGRVLGRGACSYVYKGRIGIWRKTLAIKRLNKEDKEAPKSFYRELMIASSLQSPYIVPLLGFCIDPEQGLFLVYKYVSGGSLEHHLHDKKKKGKKTPLCLPWLVRYKVALGIAEAIAYLHNGTEQCVVHRDIKPSNILLSSNKKPKLCDFGLATWTAAPSVPFLCKTVKGTFGYLAPEYFQHGKISDKTDVYAFGVVLLELITGRKPIDTRRPPGEENLVVWAKPLLHRGIEAIEDLVDPRLICTRKNLVLMKRMIRAAAACVINDESQRLGMKEILSILKGYEGKIELRTFSSRKKFKSLQTKSEIKSHIALAMLGVTEFEDYNCL